MELYRCDKCNDEVKWFWDYPEAPIGYTMNQHADGHQADEIARSMLVIAISEGFMR